VAATAPEGEKSIGRTMARRKRRRLRIIDVRGTQCTAPMIVAGGHLDWPAVR
jgi:hypothetical protein